MSGNYQSRVFTFINNRTDRLKDTCAKGLRHIKVAVVWTGQILLYPLQLLARAIQIFPPQLAPPPSQKSLPHPASDINIEQALELVVEAGYPILLQSGSANEIAPQGELAAVDDWSIIDENLWHTGGMTAPKSHDATDRPRAAGRMQSKKPIIRGLSSLLSDRQLVLVTTENELLDLLTTSQQQEIRRRIGIDIAIGWHQWRASQLAAETSSPQISTHGQAFFQQQTDDRWLEIEGQNSTTQSLFLQAETDAKERDSQLPTLRDRLQNWLRNFSADRSETNDIVSPSTLKLPSVKYPFTPQPPKNNLFLDLPQLPPIVETKSSPNQDNHILESIGTLSPNWLKNWFNYYRDYLYIPSKTDSTIVHQPSEFKLVPIEPEPQKARYTSITKKQPASLSVPATDVRDRTTDKISKQVETDVEYTPDWIETDAELIGYSRSILARFLAWLDRIVLAIENWLIKIWELITNHPAQN